MVLVGNHKFILSELKLQNHLASFPKLRNFFNKKALLNLYYAYGCPYYMYCVEIWSNAKDIYLSPLIKLQKRSVRIITHSYYLSYTEVELNPYFQN